MREFEFKAGRCFNASSGICEQYLGAPEQAEDEGNDASGFELCIGEKLVGEHGNGEQLRDQEELNSAEDNVHFWRWLHCFWIAILN